jgi:isopenicillin-N N-acyltransferase like protein
VTVRVVQVTGDPRDRGRQAGEALADLIHASLAFYRFHFERHGLDLEELPRILAPYRFAAERAFPDLVQELDGMAEGADASPWDLFAANAYEELEPMMSEARAAGSARDRCTAFAFTTSDGTFLAHNEQWLAADAGNVAVVASRTGDGPPFVSPTVACFLPAVGLNASPAAQAIMSLSSPDDGVGIPRVLVSRAALQAPAAEGGIALASTPGRAGGYAHLFAFPRGRAFTVETTSARAAVLERTRTHTNHYLDPELAEATGEPGPGSRDRLDRLEHLLRQAPPGSVEDAVRILADHGPGAQSICLHPDDPGVTSGPGNPDADSVLFSMVCHVEARRLWVAAGHPCQTPFEEIDLEEVLVGP